MLIKFISWNVNGIRALAKKPEWNFITGSDAQIIGLQETKASPEQLSSVILDMSGWKMFWDSSTVKKGYSGVAAFAKIEPLKVICGMPDTAFQGEGRLIHLEYPDFHFFTGYFPNGGAAEVDEKGKFTGQFKRVPYKMGFLESFMKLAHEYEKDKPVIVCGDFNIAAEAIDLARPKENAGMTGFLPIERNWFKKFLDSGFVDSFRLVHGDKKDQYTWWSYQNFARKKNVGWRIDYFIVSKKLEKKICNAWIFDSVAGSDHCPVGLAIDF